MSRPADRWQMSKAYEWFKLQSMNRRGFLKTSGLAGAAPLAAAQTPKLKPILITSGAAKLAQALAAGLKETYSIRLTERAPVGTTHEFIESALGHDPATNNLVRGVEAIVHVAEPLPNDNAEQQIDLMTRCTYNLLWAAAEEKIPRVVLLSTLELMTAYDPKFTVTESWRPLPSSAPAVLSKHLGEYTSREFAREGKTQIVVLRLGKVVRADEVKGQTPDPLWVEERDVVQAVAGALTARLNSWQIFHIEQASPQARFSVRRAQSALGYKPQFAW
jgi:nucleoside-diphosphate-sugar epimerase